MQGAKELAMRAFALLGFTSVSTVLALVGCSSDGGKQPNVSEVSFALEGDGQQLYMNGSPRDPSYKATYPLQNVDRLVVTIKQSGRLDAQCTRNGVTQACDDTPFYAKITRSGASCAGVHTRVFDLTGALVADVKYAQYVSDAASVVGGLGGTTSDGPAVGGGTNDGPGSAGAGAGGVLGAPSGGTADGSGTGGTGGSGAGTSSGGASGSGSSGGSRDGSTTGGTSTGGSGTSGGIGGSGTSGGTGGSGTTGGTNDGSQGTGGAGTGGASSGTFGGGGGFGGGGATAGNGSGADDDCPSGGGSSDGTGSSGASSGTLGGSSSGGGAGGTGPCSESDIEQVRAQFCAGLDAWLKQHGIKLTIDCNQLDSTSFNPHSAYDHSAADYGCSSILNQPYKKVASTLLGTEKCGGSVEIRVLNWKEEARYQLKEGGACRHSPIVLDLDGNGIALTPLERGPQFDLLATGTKVRSAWIDRGDALLAIDWNHNGVIDGARELFGESTFGHVYADGFAALRELDANGDGVVDAKDPAFAELLVWRDVDGDGISRAGELAPLRDSGITRLAAVAEVRDEESYDANGNQIPLVARFVREDGSAAAMVDAFFRYKP